ncbi:MAG: glycosyltransferase [Firmicutes bacterium]|nr:glycosyltransferase [Bacillota bacterium]
MDNLKHGQWQTFVQSGLRSAKERRDEKRQAEMNRGGADYRQILEQYVRRSDEITSGLGDLLVDIVLPVYNSAALVRKCLHSIERTKIRYRLILMDDASTDEETVRILTEYRDTHTNVRLIRNERNIGMIKTVNRGLVMTKNHVVILNVDVEMPDEWLERLMAPLIKDPTVASCTPLSNLGIITGFPKNNVENTIFSDLSVDQVDAAFRQIRSLYSTIPMGDGFCMALNKNVIKKIGILDQQTFEKSYGSSREWCIRAAQAGYRNVAVENLYVYHGHTGAYRPEEHRRMDEEFTKRILEKHPDYNKLLEDYFATNDALLPARAYVFARLSADLGQKKYLILGSAQKSSYYYRYCVEHRGKTDIFLYVSYEPFTHQYKLEYSYQDHTEILWMQDLGGVFHFCDLVRINGINAENLREYPDLYEHQEALIRYAERSGARLVAMIHDYYCICPGVYLMGEKDVYCELPPVEKCQKCLAQMDLSFGMMKPSSIIEWREKWQRFFDACQEIRVFSEDSFHIMKKTYERLDQLHIIPEEPTALPKIVRRAKRTNTVNIGLMGKIGKLEGSELVADLAAAAQMEALQLKIVLFGETEEKIAPKKFVQSGSFRFSQLPKMCLHEDIDMFLNTAIYPEVYSDIIRVSQDMGVPVASLPIGAAMQQVRRYSDGLLLSKKDAPGILDELMAFARGQGIRKSSYNRKLLFVYEKENYFMRFRIEHLREQLLGYGASPDLCVLGKLKNRTLRKYDQVVFFDCLWNRRMNRFYNFAERNGIEIWSSLSKFDAESNLIDPGLERSRGCLVPDEPMRQQIMEKYKNLTVVLQRNVISYEMRTLAKRAIDLRKTKTGGPMVFGFVSVGKSSYEDLDSIAPDIRRLMDEREDFRLKLIGDEQIPETLKYFDSRIDIVSFSSWLELTEQMTEVSYLLIPHSEHFDPHFLHMDSRPNEAGVMEVPCISEFSYADIQVEDDNWHDALLNALEDPEKCGKLGKASREWVLRKATTENLEMDVLRSFHIETT